MSIFSERDEVATKKTTTKKPDTSAGRWRVSGVEYRALRRSIEQLWGHLILRETGNQRHHGDFGMYVKGDNVAGHFYSCDIIDASL